MVREILDFGLIRSSMKRLLTGGSGMKPERASAEAKKALSHNRDLGSSISSTTILSPHDVKAIKRAIKEVADFVQNQQKRGDPRLPSSRRPSTKSLKRDKNEINPLVRFSESLWYGFNRT